MQLKVRKMEDAEMEGKFKTTHPEPQQSNDEVDKTPERGFVSKSLQSLRDFKEKVTQKLSIHDSSSDEETTSHSQTKGRKKPKSKKEKVPTHQDETKDKKVSSEISSEEKEEPLDSIKVTRNEEIITEIIVQQNDERESQDSSDSDDEKPKKPKRSVKRKAPGPPSENMNVVTTSTEVEIHRVRDSSLVRDGEKITPENKRSASYGDLACPATPKMDLSDRAISLDFRSSPPVSQISPTSPVADLSRVSDQLVHSPTSTETLSSTSSSSSETLKDSSPNLTILNEPQNESEVVISTSGTTVSEQSPHEWNFQFLH